MMGKVREFGGKDKRNTRLKERHSRKLEWEGSLLDQVVIVEFQGEGEQSGIIPRLCKDLFVRIDKDSDSEFSVEVKQCSFFFSCSRLLGMQLVVLGRRSQISGRAPK